MSQTYSLAEAREQLLQLAGHLQEPAVVTQDGKPVLAILNYEQYDALLETLEILSDPVATAQLQTSIAQAEAGETVSLDAALTQLGWDD